MARRTNCNDFSIGIELEGLEGELFDSCQYPVLAELVATLARAYPIAAVMGHEHVAPSRKRDPGPGFDWAALQSLINTRGQALPPLQFPAGQSVE